MSPDGNGWITARPLENYSSLHEFSLTEWAGWKNAWMKIPYFIELDLNMHAPFRMNPKADLAFKVQDADRPLTKGCCFIIEVTRWRTDISSFSTFDDFLSSLIRWHRCNYTKSEKTFRKYGAAVSMIETDWSEHVEAIYELYCNVAKRHGDKLYDIEFFRELAQRDDYKLLCVWFEGKIIAMSVLQEELPTLHSICCGMDYVHSSACYAYSWMHYELIRMAIESKKYENIDIGLTADKSKKEICFAPIASRMEMHAKGMLTRNFLKMISKAIKASIDQEGHLKFKWNRG